MIFLTQAIAVLLSALLLNPLCCCPVGDLANSVGAACCMQQSPGPKDPSGENHECPHRDGNQLALNHDAKQSHHGLQFIAADPGIEAEIPSCFLAIDQAGVTLSSTIPSTAPPSRPLWLRHCTLLI